MLNYYKLTSQYIVSTSPVCLIIFFNMLGVGAIITVLPSSLKCKVAVPSYCGTRCHVRSYVHLMFYILHTVCHNLVIRTIITDGV